MNVAKLIGDQLYFHCPGCDISHGPRVIGNGAWGWNGSLEWPTLTPSILCEWHQVPDEMPLAPDGSYIKGPDGRVLGTKEVRCHSYVTNGQIQFLSDCTHELRGQTVALEPFEGES